MKTIKLFEEIKDWGPGGPTEPEHYVQVKRFHNYTSDEYETSQSQEKQELTIEVGEDHYDFTIAFFDKKMTPEEKKEINKLSPLEWTTTEIPHLIEVRENYHWGVTYNDTILINGEEVSVRKIEQEGLFSTRENYRSWEKDIPKDCKEVAVGWVSSRPGGTWMTQIEGEFDIRKLEIIYDFAPDESEDLVVGFKYDGVEIFTEFVCEEFGTSGGYFMDNKEKV